MSVGLSDFSSAIRIIFSILTFCMILVRQYVRFCVPSTVQRRWWSYLSEACIVISWICYSLPIIIDATHLWDKYDDASSIFLGKWLYWDNISYLIIYYGIKASILIFYHEWMPRRMRKHCWAKNILTFVVLICFLVSVGCYMFWCWPISENWNFESDCWVDAIDQPYVIRYSLNVFTDLLIVALPISVLYHIDFLTTRQKLQAAVMFVLAAGDVIFSTVVFGASWSDTLSSKGYDTFQHISQTFGIAAACCPALRIIISRSWCYWKRRVDSCQIDDSSSKQQDHHLADVERSVGLGSTFQHREALDIETLVVQEEDKAEDLSFCKVETNAISANMPSYNTRAETTPSPLAR